MKCPYRAASSEPGNVARSVFRGVSSRLPVTLQAARLSSKTTNRLNDLDNNWGGTWLRRGVEDIGISTVDIGELSRPLGGFLGRSVGWRYGQ